MANDERPPTVLRGRGLKGIDSCERAISATPRPATQVELLRQLVKIAFDQLASAPHETIPGLKHRYYYRGKFILLEALSQKALMVNVARLRRRGETEHAARLLEAWHGGAP